MEPTIPGDSHIIRTYQGNYAPSETGSELEAQIQMESEDDEERYSFSAKLELNQRFMQECICPPSGENSSWILETQECKTTECSDAVLIRKPTASNLTHKLLNPFIYRNIQNVGTLNDLAALLDTPDDWEVRYNQIISDGHIITALNHFRNRSFETLEKVIQSSFIGLVSSIASRLCVDICQEIETPIIVGGILSKYEYDLRSNTDLHFLNFSGVNLLASEVKTNATFALGDLWYHGSKGVQVLSALYACNCPTFLLTNKQYKLFVENRERNAVLTYPFLEGSKESSFINSCDVDLMGPTFLKVIVICLLSRRASLIESMKSVKITQNETSSVKNKVLSKILEKAKISMEKTKKFFGLSQRRSPRLLETPNPTYVSGYDDQGNPIYSLVRVVPKEIVKRIEDKIVMKKKNEFVKKMSEATLNE